MTFEDEGVVMLEINRLPDANEILIDRCSFRAGQFEASWPGREEGFEKSFFRVFRFNDEEMLDLVQPSDPETWCLMHCLRGTAKLVNSGTRLNQGYLLLQQWTSKDNTAVISADGGETLLSVLTVRHSTSGTLEAIYDRIINNIKNITYQKRPGGIQLKSLLVGSPLEKAVGYEYVEIKPNSSIEPHLHPASDAFVYVVKGEGAFLVDDTRILVKEGCHGDVPRRCPHAVEAGPKGMEFISVQIPPIGSDEGYVFLDGYSVRGEVRLG
jgi:quercetin dioxygenase-like cupin family protein